MPVGMEVGPGYIMLDEDPVPPPPKTGHSLIHVYCGQTAKLITIPLGTEVGLGPGHIVLDGYPAPPTERGTVAPTCRSMCLVANGRPSPQLLSSCLDLA